MDEAVARAGDVYAKEQRHSAPTDVIAKDLGYTSANSGAALSAIASLRGYGLLERTESGKMAVSADVQSFQYAPDEALRNELLKKWLRSPPVFASLLDKYVDNLPSDATIRYDLIEKGFAPRTAELVLKVFRKSVEFANYYEEIKNSCISASVGELAEEEDNGIVPTASVSSPTTTSVPTDASLDVDRIPVRLDAKRRAWLEIPTPFYEADKERLKAQIDLLLTDDGESDSLLR